MAESHDAFAETPSDDRLVSTEPLIVRRMAFAATGDPPLTLSQAVARWSQQRMSWLDGLDGWEAVPGPWHGWLFERAEPISLVDAERRFPDSTVLLDVQCSHIVQQAMRLVVAKNGFLKISTPIEDWPRARTGTQNYGTATWDPAMKIWRRYSHGISTYPRRDIKWAVVKDYRRLSPEALAADIRWFGYERGNLELEALHNHPMPYASAI